MLKPNYLYLFLIIFYLSCNQKKEVKINLYTTKNALEYKFLPVIINGVTDDSNAFKYFNIINNSYLFGESHRAISKEIIIDSLYLRLDSISQPQILGIIAFGSNGIYRQRIFVTPGDTILLKIKDKKLDISGKNISHYSFFKETSDLNFIDVNFNGNLNVYKEECKVIFDRQNDFLKQYIKKHPKVSEEFIAAVKANIKFSYLSKLMFIYKKNASRGQTVKEILLEKTYKNNEAIFDVNSYFDNISLEELNKPEFLNNSSFKTFFTSYVRDFLVDPNLENYSNEKFLAEKEFILTNLNGELQQFAIARLINDYNTFSQTENIYNLKELIKEYKLKFSNSSYIEKVEEVESELNYVKIQLSQASLNSKLLNLKGDTLLLKDILKSSKNNIKAIDFWASWCAPCINEIIYGNSNRKEISSKSKLVWIYLSVDKNKDDWIKKSNELDEYGLTQHQYLILDSTDSNITRFFSVNKIPRYVILDKNDLIINVDAPRPSFENQFVKIINEIDKE